VCAHEPVELARLDPNRPQTSRAHDP